MEISKESLSGFIPIQPSSMLSGIEYTFIDDLSNLMDMEDTIDFLEKVAKITRGGIPSKPMIKVLDENKIVGVLTETNQFIAIDNPIDNIGFDDLEEVSGMNFMISDKESLLSNKVDEERVKSVKKINLETNFYNAFRNNARILMNKFENIGKRRDIEEILTIFHFFTLKK